MKKILVLSLFLLGFSSSIFAAGDTSNVFSATVKEIQPYYYICHEHVGPFFQYGAVERAFLNEFRKSGIQRVGKEMAVYWNSPMHVEPDDLRFDVGYPVVPGQRSAGKMLVKFFNYTKVASTIHRGPYINTFQTTNLLYRWIARQGLRIVGGPCVEVYLDEDPERVPDAQKQTEIYVPIE